MIRSVFVVTKGLLAAFTLLCLALAAQAQNVPVAVNTPQSISATITPGMTQAELSFPVNGVTRLRLDLIVPVDGAVFSLVDPSGALYFVPGDTRVQFNPGRLLPQPLPGGVFETPEITAPANGTWRIRLTFPPAPQATVALGTILAVSRWQVGIAIDRNVLLVGEDLGVGLLVLDNGTPITGLAPQITVSPAAGSPGTPVNALDNGTGPDGLANDGVYSIDHTFTAAGLFDIQGTVVVPTPNGPVQRTATQRVRVVSPTINNATVTLNTQLGPAGCFSAAQVNVGFNVLAAGNYSALVRLAASNGRVLDVRRALVLNPGPASFSAVFSAKSIKDTFGVDGPYSVQTIDLLSISGNDGTLAFRRRNAGVFNTTLAALCAQPIEISPALTSTPVLRGNLIGSLNLSFPIRVAVAGNYQISFKLIGSGGADLGLINASRSLPAGASNVTVNVATPAFLQSDGPFQAISLLVLGGGNSARLSTLGSTPAYARWQFYPAITGDLNNDGSVDAADNTLLTSFRGQPALRPGDRRDLNNDGVIDLRDARELQRLACSAPNCPVNP
jgi:hypothetical protein